VRVMAVTFSYQGNASAIQDFYLGFGARDYEQLIYDELAQQHLDNDRFQDSANVLVAFAKNYPTHPRAIEFYIRHIDAFVLGDFPARVLLAKEDFVLTYSLGAGVVVNMNTPVGRDAAPYLRDYIKQLAQTEHSIAQGIERVLAQRLSARAQGQQAGVEAQKTSANDGFVGNSVSLEQSRTWQLASEQDLADLSRGAYRKAKDYYENFIRTFEPDPEVAELRFYLGEALFALNDYSEAIAAFETYAYVDSPNPKAVEAAYAALLAYESLPASTTAPNDILADAQPSSMKYISPLSAKQTSQARFANTFEQDNRASMVALTLMQDLFEQSNYLPAQEWATWLLGNAGNETVTLTMQESAKLVMAHSYFAMQEFAQAETGYRELLIQLADADERKAGLIDRLAASLYKQAESLLVGAQLDTVSLQTQNISNKSQLTALQLTTLEQGVALLQEVVTDTPLSEFRLAAQYDSAVYFALLENWQQAIDTFLDFQQRFSQHPLSAGIDDQLFFAYEQTQDWPKAAQLLLAKHEQAPTSETGRLALYKAAEYFEKAGDRALALDNFRRYAHQYPMPLNDANEARFILSDYYLQSGDDSKRRFWLNKLVQAQLEIQVQQPALSTSRSVYLASMASMVFATDADKAFTRIKLTQPLNASLPKKQAALEKAIYEYDRVMAFGSADYVAAANYQLANLYITLADDLMNSDRPDGLSALELGQYEILLEEQAFPFEETAIDLHVNNIGRVQSGLYNDWVKRSYDVLKSVMPGRYNKPEVIVEVVADDF
jgi:TolA-binding protein